LEHTNEKEKEEEIAAMKEQSMDLAPRVQDHIPPNFVIPISILVIRAPLKDLEMEKSKKEGHVYTNIIKERQPSLRDIHYQKTTSIATKKCPIELDYN
jgi:hypothetical protein